MSDKTWGIVALLAGIICIVIACADFYSNKPLWGIVMLAVAGVDFYCAHGWLTGRVNGRG